MLSRLIVINKTASHYKRMTTHFRTSLVNVIMKFPIRYNLSTTKPSQGTYNQNTTLRKNWKIPPLFKKYHLVVEPKVLLNRQILGISREFWAFLEYSALHHTPCYALLRKPGQIRHFTSIISPEVDVCPRQPHC